MSNYVHTWTSASTGWSMKLLMIPYDSDLSQSAVSMGLGVVTLGTQEKKFNELPVGLQSEETLTVRIRMGDCPTAMQNYIKAKRAPASSTAAGTSVTDYKRNVFVLYSNRGSGSPTTVEFAGVQARTFGGSYAVELGTYSIEIELEDSFAHACKIVTGRNVCEYITTNRNTYTDGAFFTTVFDITQSNPKPDARILVDVNGDPDRVRFVTWDNIESALIALVHAVMKEFTTHSAGATESLAFSGHIPTKACTFYKATEGATRGLGAAITHTTMLIAGWVDDSSNNPLGGYCHVNDENGFASYETLFDWFKDMAENFGVKLTYQLAQTGGAGSEALYATMTADYIVPTSSTAITFASAGESDTFEFEESVTTLGYCETRWQSRDDKDVTTSKYLNKGSRASRNFTAQVKLHNAPIRMTTDFSALGISDAVFKFGLTETDRIWFYYGTNEVPTRVHETVRINYDSASYIEVSDTASALSIASKNTVLFNNAAGQTQANACLHNALSQLYVTVFGNEDCASYRLKYPIVSLGASCMTSATGARHSITGDVATLMNQYDWTKSIVTGVKVDWEEGISELSYITL